MILVPAPGVRPADRQEESARRTITCQDPKHRLMRHLLGDAWQVLALSCNRCIEDFARDRRRDYVRAEVSLPRILELQRGEMDADTWVKLHCRLMTWTVRSDLYREVLYSPPAVKRDHRLLKRQLEKVTGLKEAFYQLELQRETADYRLHGHALLIGVPERSLVYPGPRSDLWPVQTSRLSDGTPNGIRPEQWWSIYGIRGKGIRRGVSVPAEMIEGVEFGDAWFAKWCWEETWLLGFTEFKRPFDAYELLSYLTKEVTTVDQDGVLVTPEDLDYRLGDPTSRGPSGRPRRMPVTSVTKGFQGVVFEGPSGPHYAGRTERFLRDVSRYEPGPWVNGPVDVPDGPKLERAHLLSMDAMLRRNEVEWVRSMVEPADIRWYLRELRYLDRCARRLALKEDEWDEENLPRFRSYKALETVAEREKREATAVERRHRQEARQSLTRCLTVIAEREGDGRPGIPPGLYQERTVLEFAALRDAAAVERFVELVDAADLAERERGKAAGRRALKDAVEYGESVLIPKRFAKRGYRKSLLDRAGELREQEAEDEAAWAKALAELEPWLAAD